MISESKINRYTKGLKYGAAAGHGGITTEYLRSAKLPLYLSHLLTVCLQFGEVPDAFRAGVLVPILKKTNTDPGLPKNYRPITISGVPSKLLEHCIMQQCTGHEYNPMQFGFVPGRSTAMATSLSMTCVNIAKRLDLTSSCVAWMRSRLGMEYHTLSSLRQPVLLCLMFVGKSFTSGIKIYLSMSSCRT